MLTGMAARPAYVPTVQFGVCPLCVTALVGGGAFVAHQIRQLRGHRSALRHLEQDRLELAQQPANDQSAEDQGGEQTPEV